jgi:hypothetical protein
MLFITKDQFRSHLNTASAKKIFVLFLFVSLNMNAYNQIIRGTILDKNTRGAIDFATIYISGTYLGTHSDQDGNFELDITKYASLPLTISALGYYSVNTTNLSASGQNIIYMTPKVFELGEVLIKEKSLKSRRKANLKLFKMAFLGTTPNAWQCEIINENDITFNYGSDKDTLKAFASKPILIENKGLGYRVTYFLDKFELDKRKNSFFFTGNIFFNEDLANDKSQKQVFEVRRSKAYLGSRMHFFRALWLDDLNANGFVIKNTLNQDINTKNIVVQRDSVLKAIKFPRKLGICYNSTLPTSFMIFYGKEVSFDKNGYFDPLVVEWSGQMAKQRIADWLPYEYSIDIY